MVAVTSVSLAVLGVGEFQVVVMLDGGAIAILVLADEGPVGTVLVATMVVVVV